jgi:hypothetical protein
MADVYTPVNHVLMSALRGMLDADVAPARALVYSGAPTTGAITTQTLIADCPLAYPCGVIDGTGRLVLSTGAPGLVLSSAAPAWAMLTTATGLRLINLAARISTDPVPPNDELVLSLDTLGMSPGASIRVLSGAITL